MPVNAQLEIGVSKEQRNACKCLVTIISSLRYLMRTGNSVRSHDHSEGNLMEFLEERYLDVPVLNQWLKRRGKYLSSDIQNELIEIMTHNVLREIVKEVKTSYFGVIADSTTDVHGMEQFSLCLRFVHPGSLEVDEVFVGLYNSVESRGKLWLLLYKMHCAEKGVQKVLIDKQAKSLCVHCANHAADLALQEVARKMGLVKDSSNVILDSSKIRNIYADIVLQPCNDSEEVVLGPYHQLIPLCPTRWCERVKRYKQQYLNVQKTLQAILNDPGAIPPEKKATISGHIGELNTFGSLFYLVVQQQAARLLISRIATLRSDEEFDRLFDEVFVAADRLTLDHPIEYKNSKPP
ncbi:hypothetical protein PR048_000814 [Dryococelus australis]|uniref:DUF4371 domain-containing protein n=1 Tax=Dryococelus australis TaxID=614101 RepID=A0ABQ9IFP4_9NEOP|nr:hypothetical protein PR048_000814 [Dryococelus australis]